MCVPFKSYSMLYRPQSSIPHVWVNPLWFTLCTEQVSVVPGLMDSRCTTECKWSKDMMWPKRCKEPFTIAEFLFFLLTARLFHQAFISFRRYVMESDTLQVDLHIVLNDICCGVGMCTAIYKKVGIFSFMFVKKFSSGGSERGTSLTALQTYSTLWEICHHLVTGITKLNIQKWWRSVDTPSFSRLMEIPPQWLLSMKTL